MRMLLCSAFSLLLTSCGSTQVNKQIDWFTDDTYLMKYMPYISCTVRCKWHQGILKDNSKGMVPGPSRHYISGVIEIGEKDSNQLLSTYSPWVAVSSKPSKPVSGENMNIKWKSSEKLQRALVALTVYRNGELYLSESGNMIYFNLAKD